MLRALLVICLLLGSLFTAPAALAQAKAAPPTKPAWNELSAEQREALAPLAGQWATMPADRKRKWIGIAKNYPQLSPDGKTRLHARMAEFIKLTPQQRDTARENFKRAYELPHGQRQSLVQQYRELPPEKKKELAERGKGNNGKKPAAAAAGKGATPQPAK